MFAVHLYSALLCEAFCVPVMCHAAPLHCPSRSCWQLIVPSHAAAYTRSCSTLTQCGILFHHPFTCLRVIHVLFPDHIPDLSSVSWPSHLPAPCKYCCKYLLLTYSSWTLDLSCLLCLYCCWSGLFPHWVLDYGHKNPWLFHGLSDEEDLSVHINLLYCQSLSNLWHNRFYFPAYTLLLGTVLWVE